MIRMFMCEIPKFSVQSLQNMLKSFEALQSLLNVLQSFEAESVLGIQQLTEWKYSKTGIGRMSFQNQLHDDGFWSQPRRG